MPKKCKKKIRCINKKEVKAHFSTLSIQYNKIKANLGKMKKISMNVVKMSTKA